MVWFLFNFEEFWGFKFRVGCYFISKYIVFYGVVFVNGIFCVKGKDFIEVLVVVVVFREVFDVKC